LFLQSAHIRDEEVKQAVSAGQHRVESMALIHQKLYQRDNLAAVEMQDYFRNLANSLFDTFGMKDRARLKLDMEPLELDVDKAVPLGLIVNELITNSLKYAFPDGREGTIRVALKQEPGEGLVLEVEDDGVGAGDAAQGTAFGSQLVTLLSQQLGGHLVSGNQSPAGYNTRLVIGPKAG
ncbi:MAG: sensor histidine kinase, partial [Lewinella sp.]|nr:sensor histidine kinase [Lewinella sp.]